MVAVNQATLFAVDNTNVAAHPTTLSAAPTAAAHQTTLSAAPVRPAAQQPIPTAAPMDAAQPVPLTAAPTGAAPVPTRSVVQLTVVPVDIIAVPRDAAPLCLAFSAGRLGEFPWFQATPKRRSTWFTML